MKSTLKDILIVLFGSILTIGISIILLMLFNIGPFGSMMIIGMSLPLVYNFICTKEDKESK